MITLKNRKRRPVTVELNQDYCDKAKRPDFYQDYDQLFSDWSSDGDKIKVRKTLRRFKTLTILKLEESEPLHEAVLEIPIVAALIKSGILKAKKVKEEDVEQKPLPIKKVKNEQIVLSKQDDSRV